MSGNCTLQNLPSSFPGRLWCVEALVVLTQTPLGMSINMPWWMKACFTDWRYHLLWIVPMSRSKAHVFQALFIGMQWRRFFFPSPSATFYQQQLHSLKPSNCIVCSENEWMIEQHANQRRFTLEWESSLSEEITKQQKRKFGFSDESSLQSWTNNSDGVFKAVLPGSGEGGENTHTDQRKPVFFRWWSLSLLPFLSFARMGIWSSRRFFFDNSERWKSCCCWRWRRRRAATAASCAAWGFQKSAFPFSLCVQSGIDTTAKTYCCWLVCGQLEIIGSLFLTCTWRRLALVWKSLLNNWSFLFVSRLLCTRHACPKQMIRTDKIRYPEI